MGCFVNVKSHALCCTFSLIEPGVEAGVGLRWILTGCGFLLSLALGCVLILAWSKSTTLKSA